VTDTVMSVVVNGWNACASRLTSARVNVFTGTIFIPLDL
jgi:hypothetical protein